MPKAIYTFYFEDEPQYATTVDRAWLANALRAYRKHRERYHFERIGFRHYRYGRRTLAIIREV